MHEKLSKAISILWLAIITPAYGVLPLLVVLDIGNDENIDITFFLHRLEGDLLRLAYCPTSGRVKTLAFRRRL